jgi:hypothetical protein
MKHAYIYTKHIESCSNRVLYLLKALFLKLKNKRLFFAWLKKIIRPFGMEDIHYGFVMGSLHSH